MLDLDWKPDVTAGDILTLIGLIPTAIGLFMAAWQLRAGTRAQRAQFLLDTTERYFGDSEVRELFQDIDYEQFELQFAGGKPTACRRRGGAYAPFLGSKEERLLDSLLYTLDVIARVGRLAMSRADAKIFAFQAALVLRNTHIKAYLEWLDNERARIGGEVPAHKSAREFASQSS